MKKNKDEINDDKIKKGNINENEIENDKINEFIKKRNLIKKRKRKQPKNWQSSRK